MNIMDSWKKSNRLSILFIPSACILIFLVGILVKRFNSDGIPRGFFTDEITITVHDGKRYHILPEDKLDEMLVLINKNGEKHYVLSEKKLRLLGPKLLTGGDD